MFARTRDDGLRRCLLEAYDDFAVSLARRFGSRREAPEDLAQVARVGLLHALDRFDPARERPFMAFARVTILGELKRHARDHTWPMRVPRSLQEGYLEVIRAVDDLTGELGRSPQISEVAGRCGLGEEEVLEAIELGAARHPASLDLPDRDGRGRRFDPPVDDHTFDGAEARTLIDALVARLPERQREVIRLRFSEQLTQTELAARLGVSQMYVSRLLARTLTRLRTFAEPL